MHATDERIGAMTVAQADGAPYRGGYADDGVEVSLFGLAAMVLRKLGVGLAIATLIVIAGVVLAITTGMAERTYTASASFMPEREPAGGFGSGAAEALNRLGFGVSLGSGGLGSLPYYEDLLKTRSLADRVTTAQYRVPTAAGERAVTLAELAGYAGDDPDAASEAAALWLQDRLKIQANPTAGILRFEVTTPYPALSKAVADAIIEAVHGHNVARRQFEARGERHFIEGRLAEAREELQEAEVRLVGFLRENRQFEHSPELRVRYERMQREISLKQQVVITLAQGFEQARMAEVRNTPSIVVVEEARKPLRPDRRRGPLMWAVWIVLVAGLGGIAAALLAALAERSRMSGSPHYREFESALTDVKGRFLRRTVAG